MKKRLFATMLLFTCILSLTSCSKDDGDWDAMKWEKNNYEEALTPSFGKAIGVPKLGGTYTFKCKNYKNFWIEYVNESVGDKTIKNVPSYDDKPYSEVKGSYTSSKVEGNTLTVTFAPNETQDGRYVRVAVSAGDIFRAKIYPKGPENGRTVQMNCESVGSDFQAIWQKILKRQVYANFGQSSVTKTLPSPLKARIGKSGNE